MTWEPFADCTPECAVPVPCPNCGRDLPPRGRSVAPEANIPTCCDEARFTAINTRHIWSVDEMPESSPVIDVDEVAQLGIKETQR